MSIRVDSISKSFKAVRALDSVSFEVKPGELFGLIGPDGAGKTTLFRVLATLMRADSGKGEVAGFPLDQYKEIRRRVGYMPGKFSLYPDLTVEENLRFFATIFGTSIEENYDLVRDIYVQIEPFKDRRAGALSGGMKQKLALCCALIHKPEVLFLDEPTTGVDPVSRREFWEMLARLKASGLSMLVSTAYMDEASLCDRVALIRNGKLLKVGVPAELQDEFPRRIFAVSAPQKYQLILDLEAYPHTHSVFPFGESLHYIDRRDGDSREEVLSYLREKGHTSLTWEEIRPGVEDIFMELDSLQTA